MAKVKIAFIVSHDTVNIIESKSKAATTKQQQTKEKIDISD